MLHAAFDPNEGLAGVFDTLRSWGPHLKVLRPALFLSVFMALKTF